MLPIPPRLKFHGNTHAAKQFKRFALSQLEILKKQMSFQGLKQGVRRVSPFEGVLIECVSKFGLHVVSVFVAPIVGISKNYEILYKPEYKKYKLDEDDFEILYSFRICNLSSPFIIDRVIIWTVGEPYTSLDPENDVSYLLYDVDLEINEVYYPSTVAPEDYIIVCDKIRSLINSAVTPITDTYYGGYTVFQCSVTVPFPESLCNSSGPTWDTLESSDSSYTVCTMPGRIANCLIHPPYTSCGALYTLADYQYKNAYGAYYPSVNDDITCIVTYRNTQGSAGTWENETYGCNTGSPNYEFSGWDSCFVDVKVRSELKNVHTPVEVVQHKEFVSLRFEEPIICSEAPCVFSLATSAGNFPTYIYSMSSATESYPEHTFSVSCPDDVLEVINSYTVASLVNFETRYDKTLFNMYEIESKDEKTHSSNIVTMAIFTEEILYETASRDYLPCNGVSGLTKRVNPGYGVLVYLFYPDYFKTDDGSNTVYWSMYDEAVPETQINPYRRADIEEYLNTVFHGIRTDLEAHTGIIKNSYGDPYTINNYMALTDAILKIKK